MDWASDAALDAADEPVLEGAQPLRLRIPCSIRPLIIVLPAEDSIGSTRCVQLAKTEGRLFRAAAISTLVLKTTCAVGAFVLTGVVGDWNTTTHSRKWMRLWIVLFAIVNTLLLCIQVRILSLVLSRHADLCSHAGVCSSHPVDARSAS